jgi:hypothetical protein
MRLVKSPTNIVTWISKFFKVLSTSVLYIVPNNIIYDVSDLSLKSILMDEVS